MTQEKATAGKLLLPARHADLVVYELNDEVVFCFGKSIAL
jgi:hypothetical protein